MNRASVLRDAGNLEESYEEFVSLAQTTEDTVDRGWLLLNAAAILTASARYDRAKLQLEDVRRVTSISRAPNPKIALKPRLLELRMGIEFEEASLAEAEGKKQEALVSLSVILKQYSDSLQDENVRELYNTIRTRYAFLLTDLGRFQDALPILETQNESKSPQILFYLGYCYLEKREYPRAVPLLLEAIKLGLQPHLDFRAHCTLGMAYYELGDYGQARIELERGAESADPEYLRRAQIWKWLEYTCKSLGLNDDAERYARMARPL